MIGLLGWVIGPAFVVFVWAVAFRARPGMTPLTAGEMRELAAAAARELYATAKTED